MEPQHAPESPDSKKPVNWPVVVNLGLLLLNYVLTQSLASVAIAVVVLAVINGVAAFIMSFYGQMKWVTAFILSALLILLIGLGICALILSNLHVNH